MSLRVGVRARRERRLRLLSGAGLTALRSTRAGRIPPGLISFEFRLLSGGLFSGAGGEVRPAWRTFKTFCQLARICSDVMI